MSALERQIRKLRADGIGAAAAIAARLCLRYQLVVEILGRMDEDLAQAAGSGRAAAASLAAANGALDVSSQPGRRGSSPATAFFRPATDGCRWIDGDVKAGAWAYCNRPTRPGSSWCEEHHARVYRRPGWWDKRQEFAAEQAAAREAG